MKFVQLTTKNSEISEEIKDLIHKKLQAKGIDPNLKIEMEHGGVFLKNLLFDFACSFRRQERHKMGREIKSGIEDLKEN